MARFKSKLAMTLCVILLVSMLPIASLAYSNTAAESQIIGYNLGAETILLGSDSDLLRDGSVQALFDADGSYTIELEKDAFFPYEVQFSEGAHKETVWFVTPEDTVEFAGHLFRVSSEAGEEPTLTQIGLTIDGKYYAAYPEEKSFEPEAELQSLMPLKEKRFNLDLQDMLPSQLHAVSIQTIINRLNGNYESTELNDSFAVYAKWGYYDEDDNYVGDSDAFTVIDESKTLDLFEEPRYYSSTGSYTLELIVGTPDQLNLNNERYIVTVRFSSAWYLLNNLISCAVATEAREPVETYRVNASYNYYNRDKYILYIYANNENLVYNANHYLSFNWNENIAGYEIRVLEGLYETEAEIPEDAKDITDEIWAQEDLSAEGGYLNNYSYKSRYEGMPEITFVFTAQDGVKQVLPVTLYLTGESKAVRIDGFCSDKNGYRRDCYNTANYEYVDGKEIRAIELKSGYSVDEEYYLGLYFDNPAVDEIVDNGREYVKSAYLGYYAKDDEIPDTAEDIANQLFSDPYSVGYKGNFIETVVFTVIDTEDNYYWFRVRVKEAGLLRSVSFNLYDSNDPEARSSVTRSYYTNDYTSSNKREFEVRLMAGYSLNTQYYVRFYLDSNESQTTVKKAVVGEYSAINQIPESKADISAELFGQTGYRTSLKTPAMFTVVVERNGKEELCVLGIEAEETPFVDDPLSSDTYFQMKSASHADGAEISGFIQSYVMPYTEDSYYYNGYQTVFLLNRDRDENYQTVYGPVTDETIVPSFSTGGKVKMFAGLDNASGEEQKTGVTAIPFVSGKTIQYSAASEDSGHLKNYWVTFLTQQSGPCLFVNGTNDESRFVTEKNAEGQPVTDESGEEVKIPSREIFIQEAYGNKHDVFFANIGDAEITGLYARLENAQGVELDAYWRIGETTTLSPFATTAESSTYGELANLGKIRLLPIANSDGSIDFQAIDGILVIGYDAEGDGNPEQEVRIKLTGLVGDLAINTTTLRDGVKYVPYSQLIQTNNMYADDAVTFELKSGKLPKGLSLREKTGEIYGIPQETGEFEITVSATAAYSSKTFEAEKTLTLMIKDNTDENVDQATDEGYAVMTEPTEEHPVVTSQELIDRKVTTYKNLQFVSEGTYGEFVAFYIDGKMLVDGSDFNSSDGSVIIDILERTLRALGRGQHTIAIEFRDNGQQATEESYSPMHRASRNYESTVSEYHEPVIVTPTPSPTPVNPDPAEPESELTFVDVEAEAWYVDDVRWAGENKLMIGVAETLFAPNQQIDAATLITVLARFDGVELDKYADTEVEGLPENAWFTKSIKWAIACEILEPCDYFAKIKRGDVATVLAKYLTYREINVELPEPQYAFADVDEMNEAENQAFQVLVKAGIFKGTASDTMKPASYATRAQLSALIHRLCKFVEEI